MALMLGGQNLHFQRRLCDKHIIYWQEKMYSDFALVYVKFHRSSFAKSSRNSKKQTAVTDFISFLDHHGSHMFFQTILQQVLSLDVQYVPCACLLWTGLVHTKTGILHRSLLMDRFSGLE